METIDFILPVYYASALVNNDFSGLEDSEVKLLNDFINNGVKKYGQFWCLSADTENSYFSPYNDLPGMRNIGADVCNYIFDITKYY